MNDASIKQNSKATISNATVMNSIKVVQASTIKFGQRYSWLSQINVEMMKLTFCQMVNSTIHQIK